MDHNWFFRWIWRFNALVLAVVLVAAAIGLALPFLSQRVVPVVEKVVTPTAPTAQPPKYVWRMDMARAGRSDAVLSLEIPIAPAELGYSKGEVAGKTINYLFVNPDTGATRWLFPTHDQLIAATDYVTANMIRSGFNPAPSEPVLAVVYDVLPGDPTAEPAATKYRMYVSKSDGSALTRVLDNLDEAPVFYPLEGDKIFARGMSNGRSIVATISLSDFKTVMQKDISDLAPKQ